MCGMTRSNDIEHAINLGVDAIGLIFFPHSRRNVTLEAARLLTKNLPPFVDIVAVLVNPDKTWVHKLLDELPIHLLQFHGDESLEFCEQFNKPFIKAIHPVSTGQIRQVMQEFAIAQAILLDTPSPSSRGGTGMTFDWRIIPADAPKPYILAGGLNELNVRDAISESNPYAIDVCSGIEISPGIKDHTKMSRFISTLWDKS